MKEEMMKNKSKNSKKGFLFLGIVILIMIFVLFLNPDKSSLIMKTSFDYFKQMAMVFPAILILMGLFSVWTSKEFVMNHLGDSSGIKGIVVSFILGALPTGPIFIAFPMAQALRKKGASYTNIVIFLSAWACIKIPQELIEMQFLGVKFMLVRLGMTIIFITIMGLIIEKLIGGDSLKERNRI
ncbi:MAG: permease [Candidatus Cloacimonetes bacterium]|nr:permease [Candidatus Cloacimonadota bacterium]